ncbi:uncharacterized protein METZ01_LOCUS369879 [marine metagenome]|uniref:Uncharacterized protein n=1 Tax=marine metagenome TaxID=408172 RepID=A0A382T5I7_9ZZZZ
MNITKNTEENMGLLDKAKESVEKAKDISLDLVSDENLASMIVAACTKQENVNEALKTKGSIYRIADIDLVMGIPPKVVFSIHREFGD